MTSYAQNREDVLLDRAFPRGLKGFYIDVGAYDPVLNSVTKHFYDLGWHGINVEPAEAPFQKLDAARERDLNLNIGLSDAPGTITFFESEPDAGWSTASPDLASWHRQSGIALEEREIPVTTLARLCEEHVNQTIDFMTIDVEGHERQVLEGGDWSRWRPRVVVIESTQPGTPIPTHEKWEQILLGAEYAFALFDGLNRYYVRSEDRELLSSFEAPVNVTDDYVPYEYQKQIDELGSGFRTLQRQLGAARAVNQTLAAEHGALFHEAGELSYALSRLRAEYERLDTVVASLRSHYEASRDAIMQAQVRYAQLQSELFDAREQLEVVNHHFNTVSPTSLGVARRLTRMSTRFPRGAEGTKKSLQLALTAKRRLRGSSG